MSETTKTIGVTAIWMLIADLAQHDGAAPMNKHEGCWVRRLDAQWVIAVNGHHEPKRYETEDGPGGEVPPFTCSVDFNGWPAGLIDPAGGVIAAGSIANLDAFMAALRKAVSDV